MRNSCYFGCRVGIYKRVVERTNCPLLAELGMLVYTDELSLAAVAS